MSYELRKRLHSPWSLCGSVVEHRRAESEGLKFDSSWGLRSFLCPTLVTRLKSSSFLNRAQNLPSLLFLANCLFMKLQLFVSAYMNALWIHSKNCCKLITHTYACIGSPERKKIDIYMYIIYSPVGRSVLGKTVPSVLSTQERGHSFSQYGPTPGWWITFYILLHKWVLTYIHKVVWNIPEAYKRTILVVLLNNCVINCVTWCQHE